MQTHSRCFLWQLDNLICKFNGTYFIKFITNINNYDHAQLHVFPFPFSMNNASHKLVRSGNKRLILQIDQWSDITEWPSISWVIMSDIYLSHCYSIAWDIYKQLRPRPTTRRRWRLSVIDLAFAIWMEFDELCTVVWGRKTKIEFVGGQNPIMPSHILPPISPNFTNPNAFSIGRSNHCSIDARWPIVVPYVVR